VKRIIAKVVFSQIFLVNFQSLDHFGVSFALLFEYQLGGRAGICSGLPHNS
jgi:hypothetical protein